MLTSSTTPKKRVTRADVARLAGVSAAVVSYVVNNGPGVVAPATRQRVVNAIDALGYRPDLNARALATGSSRLLGLVVPDISNPLFSEFAVSIESAAAKRGYALLLASSMGDAETERQQVGNLISRRVDGLLLSSVLPYPDVVAARGSQTRVILLNAFKPHPGFSSIGTDAFRGAYVATKHLIEHGHTEIGLIIGRTNISDLEAREAGWLQAITDHGLSPGSVARESFTRDGGYRAVMRLFATSRRPSAIFASSDLQGIGALSALNELGLSVPSDVAVIAFDGTEETRFSIPPLTAVRQPIETMAKYLVQNVLDAGAPVGVHTAFASELMIRKSCGAHPNEELRHDLSVGGAAADL